MEISSIRKLFTFLDLIFFHFTDYIALYQAKCLWNANELLLRRNCNLTQLHKIELPWYKSFFKVFEFNSEISCYCKNKAFTTRSAIVTSLVVMLYERLMAINGIAIGSQCLDGKKFLIFLILLFNNAFWKWSVNYTA